MVTEPSPTSSPDSKGGAGGRDPDKGSRRAHVAPVLASEVLREDVAPFRPWERAFRIWQGVLGLVLLTAGGFAHAEVVPASALSPWIAYGLGAGLIALGSISMPYVARGTLSLLLGMTAVGLGLAGWGPLEAVVRPGESPLWEAAKVMAATALPAALLFRARYRAYLGARVALLVALAVALPAAVHAGMSVAQGPLFASVAAALTLVAILSSLMGFMGEGTTAASTAWAVFVVVMFGVELMARSLWLGTGWSAFTGDLHAGMMWMVACTLTSTGLFQLLAAAFAADARRVDVMRKRQPSLNYADGMD